MTDDHHDNSYEDTGDIVSAMWTVAYADWDGPTLLDWADEERKRRRENGERNPLVESWVASQTAPLCDGAHPNYTCVLSAGHDGGCYLRSR